MRQSFFRAVASSVKSYRLGDLLIGGGLISQTELDAALEEQKITGGPLGKVLVRRGALSAVQLYRKLAEQWCLKASATGVAILMQAATPSIAQAEDASAAPFNIQFTLAAAQTQNAYRPAQYPGLFGTSETKSNDLSAFKKWTNVMHRFDEQMRSHSKTSPRMMVWKSEIQNLKGRSQRAQIEGVNDFINSVSYIEDQDNYGKRDYWATPVEFFSRGGDCEDFAIAKYASLRALGFSTQQLRIAIVQDEIKNIPHAILIVYSDEGTFVLDNQNKRLESMAAVNRYKPIFSINSSNWWLHRA